MKIRWKKISSIVKHVQFHFPIVTEKRKCLVDLFLVDEKIFNHCFSCFAHPLRQWSPCLQFREQSFRVGVCERVFLSQARLGLSLPQSPFPATACRQYFLNQGWGR